MKVVILAGGRGRRMCAESTNLPKPLVTIGGIPIIAHIMRYFQGYGIHEFVVAVGYQSEQIVTALQDFLEPVNRTGKTVESLNCVTLSSSRYGFTAHLVDTGEETQTGGRLKQLKPFLGKDAFCLAWCDGLSDIRLNEMVSFHKSHGRLATVAAVHPMSRFGIMELAGNEVISFREKPRMSDRWVNSGYAILDPQVLDYIEGNDDSWEDGPIHKLIAENQLMAWRHDGQWQCMDTIDDQEYLEELWISGSAFWAGSKGKQ